VTESFANIVHELTRLLAAFATHFETLADSMPGGVNPKQEFALELIAAISALAGYLEQQAMEGRAIEAVKQLAEAVSWFVAESREPE
jgi:hypothetical protein